MSDDDLSPVLDAVGPRLRALRVQHDRTLADLAAETGISVSTLSRLESGQRRPTLELLLPLARAHQVPLDELVDAPETGDPRVRARPVTRGGMTMVPLTRRPGGIQAMKLLLPLGYGAGAEQRTHEGYEWLYVLDGRLRLRLGPHDMVLAPGEAAEFDTRTPHAMANTGDDVCELLALMGPQGQRAHLRARPAAKTAR
ncbi:helix-turn-helix domain-containing protein [uncultured Pseudokineococcus sp.]|uniref:helix-turn-helix domain-containing protein n=1 Tax=uncultured Pseudokineococcus sp. TaxID=1642928 RepID=UPI002611E28B|nr:XRE family transcriptional regulator [uncultured Pseudokineococcus sp.]